MRGTVVFDVNVLVSAVLAPGGTPARAIVAAMKGKWTSVCSPHIETKLGEVLTRPRFENRLTNADLNTFITGYRDSVSMYDPDPSVYDPDPSVTGVADDDEDDRVLGTAVAGRADIVVTGNKGLLAIGSFMGIPIVTARTFLDLVD